MNLGPYEPNNIYCGECAEMMSKMPDGCIDLTVTSPPYDNLRSYKGYTFDFFAIARQLIRVTKPGGVIAWVVADQTVNGSETGTSFKQALYFMAKGMRLHDTMIYAKDGAPPLNHQRYEQEWEYCFIFSKNAPKTFNPLTEACKLAGTKDSGTRRNGGSDKLSKKHGAGRVYNATKTRGNIWRYGVGLHKTTSDKYAYKQPAIFPEPLARDHILSWSNKGDLCLDPFMGSGTTAKMAMQNGRNYLGFEISPEYVELAKKRVAYANPPLLVIG